MEINGNCKVRHIGKSGIESPLLVPAFSSTAFSKASELRLVMDDLRPHLAVSSLISAYDTYHDYVDRELALSDMVIIDSGNYEKRVLDGFGCSVRWTRDQYSKAIDSVIPLTKVTIVNYDEPAPLKDQVESAKASFARNPQYSKDFLCKPLTRESSFVDVSSMVKRVDMFGDFDVLGVTDQELGPSLIEKCKNLVRLRRSLASGGLDIPIHIFGCFEPIGIILMCLLGADIFDGLNWTRYSVREDGLRTALSTAFFEQKWSIDEAAIRRMSTSQNLSQMTELMFRLRSFARTHDYATLGLGEKQQTLQNLF